jgi:hypothetical protein
MNQNGPQKRTNGFEALDMRSTRQAAETPETRKLFIKVEKLKVPVSAEAKISGSCGSGSTTTLLSRL